MVKKQALGSTPSFENVAKATLTNDLFTKEELEEVKNKPIEAEESIKEKKEEKATQSDTKKESKAKKETIEIYNPLNDPIAKKLVEEAKERRKREQLERFLNETEEEQEEQELEQRKKDIELIKALKEDSDIAYNKPTNKQRLANGYIRATFEISEEQLETIKALAIYQNIKQKDLLEELLKRGLADISEETKNNAIKYYKNSKEPKKDNKAVKDLFN